MCVALGRQEGETSCTSSLGFDVDEGWVTETPVDHLDLQLASYSSLGQVNSTSLSLSSPIREMGVLLLQ